MREYNFVFSYTEIAVYEFYSILRFEFVEEVVKRWCVGVSRFNFNRNDISVFFDDKFNFHAAVFGFVIVKRITEFYQHFRNQIFINAPFCISFYLSI